LILGGKSLKKRPTVEAKETYCGGKRDLLWRQKRPTVEAKETYCGGKRDLLWRQKRPTMEAKVSKSECELTLQSKYTQGLIFYFLFFIQ
jgi:hypothetical protein